MKLQETTPLRTKLQNPDGPGAFDSGLSRQLCGPSIVRANTTNEVLDSMRRTARQISAPQHYRLISHLPSLTRILLQLGVLDRERKEFWRFLTHTLVMHRDRLAESLRLAAMGYHFRKLNDGYGES